MLNDDRKGLCFGISHEMESEEEASVKFNRPLYKKHSFALHFDDQDNSKY